MTKSITVHAAIKQIFFDRAAVQKRLDRQKAGLLRHVGGFARKTARNLLRRRKKTSAPGSPPSVRSRHPHRTLKNILFGFPGASSVIIGPVGFNLSRSAEGRAGVIRQNRVAPNIHEFGGTVVRVRKVRVRPPRPRRRQATPAQAAAFRRLLAEGRITRDPPRYELREEVRRYPRRPFMGPAMEAVRDKFPELMRSAAVAAG